ncbi:MAG: HlyC/CorC family transporter [Gammaproteobacteria bacterium]|nr:HlyC/CorC family transporter [Gammaproteobacteria bacterium]
MLLFVTAVSVVLVISFLCSIFESVLLSLTRSQIAVVGQKSKQAGRLLSGFKQNMDVPIAAILILNTTAHTVGAAVAGASYADVFNVNTLWVFSIVFTIAVLLFTEIIPKTLGITYASLLAAPVAHGISWLTILLRPLVAMSEKISRSIRSDVNIPVTSSDELRLLAALGRSEGAVGDQTAEIIVGATQLRYLHAHDVMLPRKDVRYLSATMNRDEAMKLVRESGHSRFPFSPTMHLSDASGVILAKDLLYWLLQHDHDQIDWEAIRQDALVVPDSVPLPQLLHIYQESHRHLAIVVDEYGTVEGVATLEDVLEEIVGDIRDESDLPADDFREQPDGTLLVRGRVDLRKLSDKLGTTWEPNMDVSTIGGLVTETLERIPVVGDTIDWNEYRVEVLRADRRRARLLRVSKD